MRIEFISCPSCGKRARVEVVKEMRKYPAECPDCGCKFSVGFNRDLHTEEMQREYLLAEDYP